jgi:hypothetical protein
MGKIKNFMAELLANDIVRRALKTFIQAALAYAAVSYQSVNSVDTAKALAIGAVGAGISAVWNTLKK